MTRPTLRDMRARYLALAECATSRDERRRWLRAHAALTPMRQMEMTL